MAKLVIPFPPLPKQRPQFGNGRAYTPSQTREYEDTVRIIAKSAKIRPITGAIKATVYFYMPIPKSWSKAKKRAAMAGDILPAVKPDIDNLEKALYDALNNGIGYNDDAQIVEKHTYEYYSENPRTVVELKEIVSCQENARPK